MKHKNTPDKQPTSRNPLLWPFATDSIWNTPIGSNARYVDAKLQPAKHLTTDVEHFFVLKDTDSLQDVYGINPDWRKPRTSGTRDLKIDLPLPDELLIPDINELERPNNPAAFLMPDGETLVQLNGTARASVGDKIHGVRYPFNNKPDETLSGSGAEGGHGGSGLSAFGGSIREL